MNGDDFKRIIDNNLAHLMSGLGYKHKEMLISGNYYRASFSQENGEVWITFEPGNNSFAVYFFSKINGVLSDIDDINATPRLSGLNKKYNNGLSRQERGKYDQMFPGEKSEDAEQNRLTEITKQLHVVLPRYVKDSGI